MNQLSTSRSIFILVIIIAAVAAAFAQQSEAIRPEMRPFDFSDKFYSGNGVEPTMIFNRRSGNGVYSVVDFINDEKFCPVRIIGTFPAYDATGNLVFWTLNGELFEESFRDVPAGTEAKETANHYPLFTFPSAVVRESDRQAAVIDTSDGYFLRNALGLSVIVIVEYAPGIRWQDHTVLKSMADRNGMSLDGNPIIRTVKEVEDLTRRGLVTQRIRGTGGLAVPAYRVAPVIRSPEKGAIAGDAFLMTVRKANGKPLEAEEFIVKSFECLRKTGEFCVR